MAASFAHTVDGRDPLQTVVRKKTKISLFSVEIIVNVLVYTETVDECVARNTGKWN